MQTARKQQTLLAPSRERVSLARVRDAEGSSWIAARSLQRKASVSPPNDPLEAEADAVADRVLRMGDPSLMRSTPALIQRKCSACEDEDRTRIQTKRTTSDAAHPAPDTADAVNATKRGGMPLPAVTRAYFEPRFGYDFSHVRVHADAEADSAARSIQARAYTLGRDIVFGGGHYAPNTHAGRHLLAHELAHVVQQGGDAQRVQRKLIIDEKKSDDPTTAVATIKPLLAALCPDFEVLSGGLVWPKKGTDAAGYKFSKIAAGKQPLGCCCLSTMTAAPDEWRIVVTSKDAPSTFPPEMGPPDGRSVHFPPTSGAGAPDLRYWTAGPKQTVTKQSPAQALGHELCGHAALMQIKAHPSNATTSPDRAFSDEHDPTVRVEDALAKEMGAAGDRGLAAGGTHRGESLRVFSVGPYGADADDPSAFAAQVKTAIDFLDKNTDLLVDTVGTRDTKDTKTSVSLDRATKVQAQVAKSITKSTVDVQTTAAAKETLTRVQPATDGGVGAQPIVELRMAIRPAGLITPVGAAPPAKPVHVDPQFPAVVKVLKAHTGPNACHDLLADQAWP